MKVAVEHRKRTSKKVGTMDDVLHHIIENALNEPSHPAIKDVDSELDYGQLIDHVARTAGAMSARGVLAGDRVVLLLGNSIDYVISALASLWIGAIFVPLDATDPGQRLLGLIDDSQPRLIVVNDAMGEPAAPLGEFQSSIVTFTQLFRESSGHVDPLPIAERPSYIIYTSGTTGTPKGVVIGNRAFGASVMSCCRVRGIGPSTRTLSVSPFHFDGSFATLFTTLVGGGTLILRRRESLLFPRVFFNAIVSESVTYTGFTPSYLRMLESDPRFFSLGESKLEIIALGGEEIAKSDLEAIWSAAPWIRVFNGYGPTETTITASQMEITRLTEHRDAISIGQPNPGVQFYLLDGNSSVITQPFIPGELYIGGIQLMDGYWRSPELTANVVNCDIVAGQRLYRTGDLVYVDNEGNYVFLNRVDRVIKRGGVRISLMEVGDALRGITNVEMAASVSFDNGGQLGIAAFLVMSVKVPLVELHKQLRERLPSSMMPDRIVFVDELPMTPSGKTDDRRLLSGADLLPWIVNHADGTPEP